MSFHLSSKPNYESQVQDVIINFGAQIPLRRGGVSFRERAITELRHVISDVGEGALCGAIVSLSASALLGFSAWGGCMARTVRAVQIITLLLVITGIFVKVVSCFVTRRLK